MTTKVGAYVRPYYYQRGTPAAVMPPLKLVSTVEIHDGTDSP